MHQSQVIICFLRGPLRCWQNRKTQNSFEVCETRSVIQWISYVEKSKESYPGLSSTTDESSDSRSDWTEDVDDADEGRSMMGTDPWAHESVTAATGSKKKM